MVIDEAYQRDVEESSPLSDIERFCLRSYFLAKTDANRVMAYTLSRGTDRTGAQDPIAASKKWFNSIKVRAYLRILTRQYAVADEAGLDKVNLDQIKDKESVIKMYKNILDQTQDDKLKASLLDKIAGLRGYKSGNQSVNDFVSFFIPLKCTSCTLKILSSSNYLEWSESLSSWVPTDSFIQLRNRLSHNKNRAKL